MWLRVGSPEGSLGPAFAALDALDAGAGPLAPRVAQQIALVAARATGWRRRRIRTSAGHVHVLDGRGAGRLPGIVMLHGLGSCGIEYGPLLWLVRARARRVVAPDLLGHGFSDAPLGLTADQMHDALVESLDAVLDRPAVLFGNSLGGLAAIRYAIARPSRVRALVLCSPGGAPPTPEELRDLVATFRLRTHADALAFADRLLAAQTWMRPLVAWGARHKFAHPTIVRLLDRVRPDDFLRPDELAAVRVPTLVVWGRQERILPRTHLAFFRAHLPHAHVLEPDGFGHGPFLDRPLALARTIVRFVERLERA